jgi:16S rRNA A1518/A1519 N6-dimethyltransferase RsmA/KsgA/DIM1 with predicted DNA glycosylase/AP lyase activity
LSLWAQRFSNPAKICDVPPTAFRPQPKITSTVLKFTPNGRNYDANEQKFLNFIKLIFSQRRKKISSVLRSHYDLTVLNDSPLKPLLDDRAEHLTMSQMEELFQIFS